MKTITNRQELIAYKLAEFVCLRNAPVTRRATVVLWAEVNNIQMSEDDIDYALGHWHDYVTITF